MDKVTADAMPGQVHPALAGIDRAMVFTYGRRNGLALVPYSAGGAPVATREDFDTVAPSSVRTHTLTLRKVAAPCPYVGTRQWFTWDVLEDELGRFIADDKVYRVVDESRAFIEGWRGADDELSTRAELRAQVSAACRRAGDAEVTE